MSRSVHKISVCKKHVKNARVCIFYERVDPENCYVIDFLIT